MAWLRTVASHSELCDLCFIELFHLMCFVGFPFSLHEITPAEKKLNWIVDLCVSCEAVIETLIGWIIYWELGNIFVFMKYMSLSSWIMSFENWSTRSVIFFIGRNLCNFVQFKISHFSPKLTQTTSLHHHFQLS
jgi:hypothetical protein